MINRVLLVLVVLVFVAVLVPLMAAGMAEDELHRSATRRVFKSWRQTWKRLGRGRRD